MSKLENHKIQQCGVCGCLTSDGRNIESSLRHGKTGITEFGNFICRHCDWELRNLRLVDRACDRQVRKGQGS